MASPLSAFAAKRAPLETRSWFRQVGRAGPEFWVWPVAAACWLVLAWSALGWYPLGTTSGLGHHLGMAHSAELPVAVELADHLALWTAMVGATMLPLIARNLRGVALRSPRARRTGAAVQVAAGWALVWLAAGVLLIAGLLGWQLIASTTVVVGVICAAAVGWQFTRLKQLALARCDRRFAPPLGARAGAACRRFGQSLGRDCLVSCWPGMALMMAAGHTPLVIVALACLSWRDRRLPHDRPGRVLSVAVLLGVGAYAVLGQA